jgi:hypothetical protein
LPHPSFAFCAKEGGDFDFLTRSLKEPGFGNAIVVPTHFDGWAHFSEGKEDILRAFRNAGIEHRLFRPKAGNAVGIPANLRAAS